MGSALEADLTQENSEAMAQALCLALGAAEGAPVEPSAFNLEVDGVSK